jgi:hypothetical protein
MQGSQAAAPAQEAAQGVECTVDCWAEEAAAEKVAAVAVAAVVAGWRLAVAAVAAGWRLAVAAVAAGWCLAVVAVAAVVAVMAGREGLPRLQTRRAGSLVVSAPVH